MLISLGYSCQTRFMIDTMYPDLKRQPFDFNISTRPALIRALETDGASLEQRPDETSIYMMPKERREGIEVSGLVFWHDYPLAEDKLALHPDWQVKRNDVNAKYAMLWRRFSEVLRSDTPKTLVLSNSQHNLPQFAADDADFDLKFGLGRLAFQEISDALDAYGARAYRLKFLSRLVKEVQETADLHDRLDHRFVGALSLRVPPDMVSNLFSHAELPGLATVGGAYDSGERVVSPISGKVALIFEARDNARPSLSGGLFRASKDLVAAFEGRDRIFRVIEDGGALHFSNGTRWVRDPGRSGDA